MIHPKPSTIGEILTLSKHFVVPVYQRGFAWEANEASDFFNDLVGESEQGRGLFLGTLIFNVAAESHNRIVVVDGQQRLTTIFLMLIACRELAKELKCDGIAHETQKRITVTDPATAQSRGPLLEASDTIREVFENMTRTDWDRTFPQKIGTAQVKRKTKRVRPVYEFFWNQLQTFDQPKLSQLLESIYKTRVIRIDIDGDEEAFSIFERPNARGTDLEVSDLLKNYLYQQKVPELDDKWRETLQNSEGTILKMLKYFYVSQRGPVRKTELFPKLKRYSNDIGGATHFVERLSQFSRYYAVVRKEQEATSVKDFCTAIGFKAISADVDKYQRAHLALQSFRLFKVSQNYPVLYAAIEAINRNGEAENKSTAKLFLKILDVMEKYHFINNAVCDRVGNEVEKLYASFCEKFAKTKNFPATTAELLNSLRKQLASQDEFESRFVDITYISETIPLIAYIFDRFSNYDLAPGERVKIYDPQAGVRRNNHNVEHWLAQNVKEYPIDSATQQAIDNIGNLLVISFRTNSKLGDRPPAKKLQKLEGELSKNVQNLHYVRDFIKMYGPKSEEWTDKVILERARNMAREAYTKIWKLPET